MAYSKFLLFSLFVCLLANKSFSKYEDSGSRKLMDFEMSSKRQLVENLANKEKQDEKKDEMTEDNDVSDAQEGTPEKDEEKKDQRTEEKDISDAQEGTPDEEEEKKDQRTEEKDISDAQEGTPDEDEEKKDLKTEEKDVSEAQEG